MACREMGFRYRYAYMATHMQNPQYLELAGRWRNSSGVLYSHRLVWTDSILQISDRTKLETRLEQRQHISGTTTADERSGFDVEMPDDAIIHDHGITLGPLTQTENAEI